MVVNFFFQMCGFKLYFDVSYHRHFPSRLQHKFLMYGNRDELNLFSAFSIKETEKFHVDEVSKNTRYQSEYEVQVVIRKTCLCNIHIILRFLKLQTINNFSRKFF